MAESDTERVAGAEYLGGSFLISTRRDATGGPFDRSVVLMCTHDDKGAMGLIVNASLRKPTVGDLLEEFGHGTSESLRHRGVHFGGPVETGRGFVLHGTDYSCDGTIEVADGVRLSMARQILVDLAEDRGPVSFLVVMGYAGWGAGQLERELQRNDWLTGRAYAEIVFADGSLDKWEAALTRNGIQPIALAPSGGVA